MELTSVQWVIVIAVFLFLVYVVMLSAWHSTATHKHMKEHPEEYDPEFIEEVARNLKREDYE